MKKTINSIEQLKKVFFLVLGLVAFINGLNYYISQEYLVSEKKIHASINLSTKQRMLSQEILATAFIYAMIPSEREATKKTLKQLTRELERNNKTLINGSSELIGAMKLDRSFYSMYFENPVNINYKTKRTVYMVYDLLEDNADLITFENEHVYLLKEYSPILLQALQKAIDKFQEVGAEAANARDIIRLINMSVTLLALVFLAYYVLFPVVKRVKTREYQLSAQHDLLDLIIDSTTNALVVMNDHSEVLIFNKAAQKMFGYSSSQMVGSDTLHYIIPKEYQAKHQKGSTHFFKTGESSGLINNTTLVKGNRSNGEIFDIEIGFGAGVLGGKRIVVANMVDVSERLASMNEIKALNHKLQSSLDSEKRFLASISHEIRTPLNAVIGFLDLLNESYLRGEEGSWVSKAHISAQHLLTLINDILDVSKIEAGQMELSHLPFSPSGMMEECKVILSTHVADGVTFNLKYPDIAYDLVGDELRIKQIFLNLLSNAIKFTKVGHINFELKGIEVLDDHKVKVRFSVEDTGKGISDEKAQGIFSAFKQANSTDNGTGLGLYISKNLTELMDGSIALTSELGHGSTFDVDLVLERSEFKKDTEVLSVRKEREKIDFSMLRVLLVDDVAMNISLASVMFLRNFNIVIDKAFDGKEASDMVKRNTYDVVFMDIQMPVMDGFESTLSIREFNKEILIYAMSANAYAEHKDRATEVGMNGYITKPISKTHIIEVLHKAQEGKK